MPYYTISWQQDIKNHENVGNACCGKCHYSGFWSADKRHIWYNDRRHVPQGRLPVTLPADMDTVETHCEDLTSDIRPYTDSEGHIYAAGFGM